MNDGILYVQVSNKPEQTIEIAQKFISIVGEIVNYKKVPMLVKHDEFALPDKNIREFWAKKDSCPYTSAEAYIAITPAHKLISNFYMKIEKPGRPTKMFNNTTEAIKWLKNFL